MGRATAVRFVRMLVASIPAVTTCVAQSQEKRSPATFREVPLADALRSPPQAAQFFVVSPDGRRWACRVQVEHGYAVVVDGVRGEVFEACDRLTFSPDSRRFVYAGWRAKQHLLVEEGKAGKGYEHMASLFFSPDSRTLVFAARLDDAHWCVVTNGRESRPFDFRGEVENSLTRMHWPDMFVFSPDAKHVAYAGTREGGQFLVLDGVEQPLGFAQVAHVSFSPDGKRLAYWGRRGRTHRPGTLGSQMQSYDGRWSVVLDGKEGEAHDAPVEGAIVFSPDSARVCYLAADQKPRDHQSAPSTLVVDGKALGSYHTRRQTPRFSPDSRHVLLETNRNDTIGLVVDGEVYATCTLFANRARSKFAYLVSKDGVDRLIPWALTHPAQMPSGMPELVPLLSPDGERRAQIMTALDSDFAATSWVEVDGATGKRFGDIAPGSLQFCADGSTVGYVASDVPHEDARVVVGDEEQEPQEEVRDFALGPQGKRMIYQARKGTREFAIVDGKRIDHVIAIAFGPEQQIVTVVKDPKSGRVHVDIDGASSPEYDEFVPFESSMLRSGGRSGLVLRARRGDAYFVLQVAF